MLFPMYVVPLNTLLQMTKIEPHEVLKARAEVEEFETGRGKAFFVSHQWLDNHHPDPDFTQMRVLQDALKHLMCDLRRVELDSWTEIVVPSAKTLPTAPLRSAPVFLWYDYFSCPQLEPQPTTDMPQHTVSRSNLGNAISSIPAYVVSCSLFLVLSPVLESPDHTKLLTPASWAQRGWCRVERMCREMSEDGDWVMIRSGKLMEVISCPVVSPAGGSPGEGQFTVPEDREILGPILMAALRRKLRFLMHTGDLVGFRVLLNHQPMFLRGFENQPEFELVPGFETPTSQGPENTASLMVSKFLHHNGFRHVPGP
ncbi:unnamed protein product [Symbiodinium pilosum]|uniref:Uncharacterized protein n=1 Tax=Symbiodinium pilosum TaxID=2952 RepID=A0A812YHN5_SYMPI|nr:unnamed protein product [Symbiodinium pilosum]